MKNINYHQVGLYLVLIGSGLYEALTYIQPQLQILSPKGSVVISIIVYALGLYLHKGAVSTAVAQAHKPTL